MVNLEKCIHGRENDPQNIFSMKINKLVSSELTSIINRTHSNIISANFAQKNSRKIVRSQIYLDNLIEIIPYFVFWKDAASIYLGCNQRFATLVGQKSPKHVIGKTDFDLNWGEGEAEFYRICDQEVMNGKTQVNAEELLYRPDGTRTVMLVSKVPLLDNNDICIGILGTSTDITERKKLEEDLIVAKEQAEAALIAKEKAEIRAREKSKILNEVLKGLDQDRYYLTGKYKGIYLTNREAECVVCWSRGLSAKEIGRQLTLSPKTVEVYIDSVKKKFNCSTRSELVAIAIEAEFLESIRPVMRE